MTKKLLLIADAWPPQINGAARVAHAHARGLQEEGWEVEVVHTAQFFNMPMPFSVDIRLALFARRAVARRIRQGGFSAVHIVAEGPLGLAARRACLKEGVPFTTWYHTRFDVYLGVYVAALIVPPIRRYLRWFHSAAQYTMVSTPTLKVLLESEGYRNVAVVPLGVDTTLFTRNPATPIVKPPTPVFVYFGRLAPEKSPEEFLRLQLPGTKLVIGDGPLRTYLEERYPSARFVGFQTGQNLVDWLSVCDVFVFPSRTETFGLVQLEAMSMGIPVAAHDVLGPHDVVTVGKDGYLGDNLADCALKCLQLKPEDCRKKAEKYSWEHSTKQFIKHLAVVGK